MVVFDFSEALIDTNKSFDELNSFRKQLLNDAHIFLIGLFLTF